MTPKKIKLILITVICILALAILPFVVNLSYKLGEIVAIIRLPFSEGEILSYIASAMGVSISIIALLVALNAGNPDIKIARIAVAEFSIDDKEMQKFEKIQQGISITNRSPVEVSVVQTGLISKKKSKTSKKRLMATIMWNGIINYPIKIQPYDSVSICCDSERLHKNIYQFGQIMEENDCQSNDVIFFVKLACGEIFEFKSKDDHVLFEAIPKEDKKGEKNENADQ